MSSLTFNHRAPRAVKRAARGDDIMARIIYRPGEVGNGSCTCAGAGCVVALVGVVSSGSLAHEASTIAIIENTEKIMMDFFIARIVVD